MLHEELAQLAQANAPQLNQEAIQEGAYDINFTLDGFEYNFESDGQNFTWGYHATNAADTVTAAASCTLSGASVGDWPLYSAGATESQVLCKNWYLPAAPEDGLTAFRSPPDSRSAIAFK